MSSHHYILHTVPTAQLQQWDQFVNAHPHGHLLQSWGWGELKASAGWHPQRLALWDNHQQQIVAAAQVLARTAPHFPLWAGHLAYIPKGPVLDWSEPLICQAFVAQLHTHLRRHGAMALRMEPGLLVHISTNDCIMDCLAPTLLYPVSPVQPIRTILLDITPDETTLLGRMK